MQSIRIGVVRSRKYRAADAFQVYSDRATGTMDWEHPVTARRVMFWEDAPSGARQHLGAHLMGVWLDGVWPDGHMEGTHLLDERGFPAATIAYDSDPLVFGRFRHAVVTQDAAGNALTEGVAVHESVINSAPPPAGDLRVLGVVYETHRVEFSFTASPRLIG
jgi:hypothetical protein